MYKLDIGYSGSIDDSVARMRDYVAEFDGTINISRRRVVVQTPQELPNSAREDLVDIVAQSEGARATVLLLHQGDSNVQRFYSSDGEYRMRLPLLTEDLLKQIMAGARRSHRESKNGRIRSGVSGRARMVTYK